MWKISKSFEFNYGHRIATQSLNKEFSLDQQCKCRHLHGHTASIEVCLQSDKLKDGFVTDFYHLNWLKEWINKNIDHKFILDDNDPITRTMFEETFDFKNWDPKKNDTIDVDGMGSVYDIDNLYFKKYEGRDLVTPKEYYESFFFVNFPPTSECLAKWIYDFVAEKMKPLGVEVASVTWYESPNSKSVYSKK